MYDSLPEELTTMIENDKALSPNQQVRLLLASIRLTYKTIADMKATLTAMSWDIQSIKDHLKDHTTAIMSLENTFSSDSPFCRDCPKDSIRNNYINNLVYYLQLHPKLATSFIALIFTILLIFLALWIDPQIRHMIFEFLRFPPSVTDALSQ